MLYRVHENLSGDGGRWYEKCCISDLKNLSADTIKNLLQKGSISVVSSPPLELLAGWEGRAEVLKPLGVVSVADFLESNKEDLAIELDTSKELLEEAAEDLEELIESN